MGHLSDGRFLYGHNGVLRQQNAFGNAASTSFTNAFGGDYAFVTSTFAASGAWGGGPVYSFDGTNTASPFSSIGSYQNYAGVNRGSGLLLVGTNGTGSKSSLGYLTTGNVFTTLIDNISEYSAGLTVDANGNVWIINNDNNDIVRFTSAQIDAAIGGTSLTMGNGTYITNLGVSGSLAVDVVSNRLYAAGWQTAGIQVFDLNTLQTGTLVPGASNENYQVMLFGDGVNRYIGWLNRDGWAGGDAVTYGYALSDLVPLPEPSAALLVAFAAGGFFLRRKLAGRNR